MTLRILTFVTDREQYSEMLKSFAANGFTTRNSAFVTYDNRHTNRSDPYGTVNAVLDEMPETLLVVCHQDVRLNAAANYDALIEQLRPAGDDWGVAGPAGITLDYRQAISIIDPWQAPTWPGSWPVEVQALDESFIVIRPGGARLSRNLSGFHFYGADLCLSAQRHETRAIAINFPLTHLSDGRAGQASVNYRQARRAFQAEVSKHYVLKLVVTSTGETIVLSRYRWLRYCTDRPRMRDALKAVSLRFGNP